MRRFYERTAKRTIIIFIFATVFTLCSCNYADEKDLLINHVLSNVFSVNFLSVGQGDCILINFADGKVMLIDCGNTDDKACRLITDTLGKIGCDKIEYLVLTHTGADHVGNVEGLLKEYSVGTAFVPEITDESRFPKYKIALDALRKNTDVISVSQMNNEIFFEGGFLVFLWPNPSEIGFEYDNINSGNAGNDNINDSCSVIYLEYMGVRFLFTADIGKKVCDKIIEYDKVGLYNETLSDKTRTVNLQHLDYLKVAHHGDFGSVNTDFLAHIRPKNSIISVGQNDYGHPSTRTLTALLFANPDMNIYRTDVDGNISVTVDSNGNQTIRTSID